MSSPILKREINRLKKKFKETKTGSKQHKKIKKRLEKIIRAVCAYDRTKWSSDPVKYCEMFIDRGWLKSLNMFDIMLDPFKTELMLDLAGLKYGSAQDEEILNSIMGQEFKIIYNNAIFIHAKNINIAKLLTHDTGGDIQRALIYNQIVKNFSHNETEKKKLCPCCVVKECEYV